MLIAVIDGMGGGIGKAVVERLKMDANPRAILALGTNAIATAAMHKAGADQAATGENAIVVACRKASVIIGTMGIVLADAMLGEISPAIAHAISSSDAVKILIPSSRCNIFITGHTDLPVSRYIDDIPTILEKLEDKISQ